MENVACLAWKLIFMFLFQNVNCSSGDGFYLGGIKILRKQEKTK
jgi:hypothetical protein